MVFIPVLQLLKDLEDNGYTLTEIAKMANCSVAALSLMKSEGRDPRLSLYMSIYSVWELRINSIGDNALRSREDVCRK